MQAQAGGEGYTLRVDSRRVIPNLTKLSPLQQLNSLWRAKVIHNFAVFLQAAWRSRLALRQYALGVVDAKGCRLEVERTARPKRFDAPRQAVL